MKTKDYLDMRLPYAYLLILSIAIIALPNSTRILFPIYLLSAIFLKADERFTFGVSFTVLISGVITLWAGGKNLSQILGNIAFYFLITGAIQTAAAYLMPRMCDKSKKAR